MVMIYLVDYSSVPSRRLVDVGVVSGLTGVCLLSVGVGVTSVELESSQFPGVSLISSNATSPL